MPKTQFVAQFVKRVCKTGVLVDKPTQDYTCSVRLATTTINITSVLPRQISRTFHLKILAKGPCHEAA